VPTIAATATGKSVASNAVARTMSSTPSSSMTRPTRTSSGQDSGRYFARGSLTNSWGRAIEVHPNRDPADGGAATGDLPNRSLDGGASDSDTVGLPSARAARRSSSSPHKERAEVGIYPVEVELVDRPGARHDPWV
jgi:hypothetical protein